MEIKPDIDLTKMNKDELTELLKNVGENPEYQNALGVLNDPELKEKINQLLALKEKATATPVVVADPATELSEPKPEPEEESAQPADNTKLEETKNKLKERINLLKLEMSPKLNNEQLRKTLSYLEKQTESPETVEYAKRLLGYLDESEKLEEELAEIEKTGLTKEQVAEKEKATEAEKEHEHEIAVETQEEKVLSMYPPEVGSVDKFGFKFEGDEVHENDIKYNYTYNGLNIIHIKPKGEGEEHWVFFEVEGEVGKKRFSSQEEIKKQADEILKEGTGEEEEESPAQPENPPAEEPKNEGRGEEIKIPELPSDTPPAVTTPETKGDEIPTFSEADIAKKRERKVKLNRTGDFGVEITTYREWNSITRKYTVWLCEKTRDGDLEKNPDDDRSKIFTDKGSAILYANSLLNTIWENKNPILDASETQAENVEPPTPLGENKNPENIPVDIPDKSVDSSTNPTEEEKPMMENIPENSDLAFRKRKEEGHEILFLKKPDKGSFSASKASPTESGDSYFILDKTTMEIVPITSDPRKFRELLLHREFFEGLLENPKEIKPEEVVNLVKPIKVEPQKNRYVVTPDGMGAYKA